MTDTFNDRNMATRNPFIISGRIPDEFFCDRVDESRYLINKIEGQASNILLVGPALFSMDASAAWSRSDILEKASKPSFKIAFSLINNILVSNDYGMTDGSCRCVIEESP